MACQALGRCRICARKHKIAVFGGAEEQHFMIEKTDLKLIILNSVCVGCIGKIERFVKKMDLDIVFNDYIKDENGGGADLQSVKLSKPDNLAVEKLSGENERTIESQESNKQANDLSRSMAMLIDHPARREKNIEETGPTLTTNCDSCTSLSDDATNTQPRPQYAGDSQSAASTSPRRSIGHKIGRETFAVVKSSGESRRKRPRDFSEKILAGEEGERDSKSGTPLLSSSSSASTIAFVDCGSGKKSGRFLSCDFCKKEFTHAGDLNKHRRKHTGEKPYECNQCQRKFAHASNLARHQRVHSGERPFVCPRCTRTFTRRDKLAIHVTAGRCSINTPRSTPVEETQT